MLINLRVLPVELGAKEGKDPCGIKEATSTGTISQLHRITQVGTNKFHDEAKQFSVKCSFHPFMSGVSVHHTLTLKNDCPQGF